MDENVIDFYMISEKEAPLYDLKKGDQVVKNILLLGSSTYCPSTGVGSLISIDLGRGIGSDSKLK